MMSLKEVGLLILKEKRRIRREREVKEERVEREIKGQEVREEMMVGATENKEKEVVVVAVMIASDLIHLLRIMN